MTASLYALGRFCCRHHYATIAAWLIVTVALVLAGQSQASRTNDNLTLPGTDSTSTPRWTRSAAKAVMVLLGRWAWWLPGPLERLVPHVSIEGEDFFARRDAALAADGPKSRVGLDFSAHRPPE